MTVQPPPELKQQSLSEIHGSVQVPRAADSLRRFIAFLGPGYLVAVGYMDPGNWATSLAGGSAFGYTLLSVALLSSVTAMLLQALAVRLGIASGRDLAQLCRSEFPKPVNLALWALAELAICATDLAELIGTAIALQLLFGIPLLAGVFLTALDAVLILYLQNKGVRWLEAVVAGFILIVVLCFMTQIILSQPPMLDLLKGYVPTYEVISDDRMLYVAIGILGATVMPHNLYLHTALVQSRSLKNIDKKEAIKFASIDSTIALTVALFVNSAILITAAATFHTGGHMDVAEIQDAHKLLTPLLGTSFAATLFALALLLCGLNATITATLAGQVVMEGFINLRLRPPVRRLLTRGVAIVPAIVVIWMDSNGGATKLLLLSQVVLSMQLPFAIIPMIMFSSNKQIVGIHFTPKWQYILACSAAIIIVLLNIRLIYGIIY